MRSVLLLLILLLGRAVDASATAQASTCYGAVAHGRLAGSVQLPIRGANFVAYSSVGVALGRNYVHATVRDIVVDAYRGVAQAVAAPGPVFEYGETGWRSGGRFRPHRSHQAGLSVDFMVPVRDASGASVPLPAGADQQFGYAWEFDGEGRAGAYRIDFEAMGEHLFQLALAAQRHGVKLGRVIFDPGLTRLLLKTRHGRELEALPFMKQRPWVRHDEHYHVDFDIACRPLAEYKK